MSGKKKSIWEIKLKKQDSERCFGVVADETFILVCEYGCNGADPEIVLYKRRGI